VPRARTSNKIYLHLTLLTWFRTRCFINSAKLQATFRQKSVSATRRIEHHFSVSSRPSLCSH